MRAVVVPEWAERIFRLTVAPTFGTMAPFEMVAFGAGKHGSFQVTWRRRPSDALPPQTVSIPGTTFRPGQWRVLNDLLDRSGFWVLPTLSPFDTSLDRDGVCFALEVVEPARQHLVSRHTDLERTLSRIVNHLVDATGVFEIGSRVSHFYRCYGQAAEGERS
jgi:hypothetical protein